MSIFLSFRLVLLIMNIIQCKAETKTWTYASVILKNFKSFDIYLYWHKKLRLIWFDLKLIFIWSCSKPLLNWFVCYIFKIIVITYKNSDVVGCDKKKTQPYTSISMFFQIVPQTGCNFFAQILIANICLFVVKLRFCKEVYVVIICVAQLRKALTLSERFF